MYSTIVRVPYLYRTQYIRVWVYLQYNTVHSMYGESLDEGVWKDILKNNDLFNGNNIL